MFLIFFNMKVSCVFSLESPHSNENTQYTIFNIQSKKISLNYPKFAATRIFPRDSKKSSKQPK